MKDFLDRDLVRAIAEETGKLFLDPGREVLVRLIQAIVMVESGGYVWAVRFEPDFRWLVQDPLGRPHTCSVDTEYVLQKTSWGLCQIMGATARDLGVRGWLTELLKPNINIFWGMKYLQSLGRRYAWDEQDMISAYNQGSARKGAGGRYLNETYVNKVVVGMTAA